MPGHIEIGSPLTTVNHLSLSVPPRILLLGAISGIKMLKVTTLMKFLTSLDMIPTGIHLICPPLMIVSM